MQDLCTHHRPKADGTRGGRPTRASRRETPAATWALPRPSTSAAAAATTTSDVASANLRIVDALGVVSDDPDERALSLVHPKAIRIPSPLQDLRAQKGADAAEERVPDVQAWFGVASRAHLPAVVGGIVASIQTFKPTQLAFASLSHNV